EVCDAGRVGDLKPAPRAGQVAASDQGAARRAGRTSDWTISCDTQLEYCRLVRTSGVDPAHDVDLVGAEYACDSETGACCRKRGMWRCDQRYGLRGVLFNGREHSARGILAADHKHSGTDDAKGRAGPVVSTQGQS